VTGFQVNQDGFYTINIGVQAANTGSPPAILIEKESSGTVTQLAGGFGTTTNFYCVSWKGFLGSGNFIGARNTNPNSWYGNESQPLAYFNISLN
jgi:hypothetical protein